MQRPVHPSYGRVKQNVYGCLFVWTGKSRSPVHRTAQSALHVMSLSYYIGMCVFHERQCDICRRRREEGEGRAGEGGRMGREGREEGRKGSEGGEG